MSADIDLFADEVLLDPYPVYAELRETAGVVHLPRNEAYALTRYDLVRDALADYETFSSVGLGFNDMVNGALQGTSLASDPPAHTQLRAALSENLTPRALRNLKELIDAKADALVADLVEQGSFEAIDALARAFPLEVVADLIGFTGDVRNNMIRWGAAAMEVVGPLNQRTGRELPDRRRAVRLVRAGLGGRPDARLGGARGLRGRGAGHHPARAPRATSSTSTSAPGLDSTIAAIGNTVALFAAHPEQFALVRQDPSLVPAAFNEVLRYWAPLNVWGRTVTKDVEIDGSVIPAGSKAAIMIGGGNRDARHYENADAFLVERNPVDLLSFGYGIHSCAGQGLARLEGQAIIEALARRVERIVVGPEERQPSNMVRSISVLPVLEVVPA